MQEQAEALIQVDQPNPGAVFRLLLQPLKRASRMAPVIQEFIFMVEGLLNVVFRALLIRPISSWVLACAPLPWRASPASHDSH